MNIKERIDSPERDELLSRYLDGELAPEETEALEHLLETNETARSELESLRKTVDLMGMLKPIEAPSGFSNKVRRRVRRHRNKRRDQSGKQTYQWQFGSIAIVLIVVFAMLYILVQLNLPKVKKSTPKTKGQKASAPLPGRKANKKVADKKPTERAKATPARRQTPPKRSLPSKAPKK